MFGDSILEKKSDKAVKRSKSNASFVKGATKSCFMYCSSVVIIFFNTGLWRSAFSTIFFGKRVFRLSVLSVLFVESNVYTKKCVMIT